MFKFKSKFKIFLTALLLFPVITSFNPAQVDFSTTPVFIDGEKLTFRLRYGIINGGEATTTAKITRIDGQEVFHTVLIGRTTGMVDKIYKVYDVYESFFDLETNLPVKAIRNIREGNYRYYDEVTFNQDDNYVVSRRNGKVDVPKNTLDMACVLYYIRRLDMNRLRMNEVIALDTYFSDEHFPFFIVYKGKETITIGSGQYRCFKFVPVVEPGRVFEKKDDMTIWFSDDANKIPVSIKFDIRVGSFRCDLASFENLKFPLRSKIK